MRRYAKAVWRGDGMTGTGRLTTNSGALSHLPYSFKTRFESEDGRLGTNPEELLGAAHSGCFAMALSFALSQAGFPPQELAVEAVVEIDKADGGFAITGIGLSVSASVPGIDPARFEQLAGEAKANCPLSKALAAVPIQLQTRLQ